MNENYYNQNIDFIYNECSTSANNYYKRLRDYHSLNIDTFCLNETDKINYFENNFKEIKNEILSMSKKNVLKFHLINTSIIKNEVIINKERFILFAKQYLEISNDNVFQIITEVISENLENLGKKIIKNLWSAKFELFEYTTEIEYYINLNISLNYFRYKLNEVKKLKNSINTFNSKIFTSSESERFFNYVVDDWIQDKKEPLVYISYLFRQLWENEKENTETIINDFSIHCSIDKFISYCNNDLNLKKQIDKIKTYNDIGTKSLKSKQNDIKTYLEIFKKNQ